MRSVVLGLIAVSDVWGTKVDGVGTVQFSSLWGNKFASRAARLDRASFPV